MKEQTILIVENNKTPLYFLKKSFRLAGFDVFTAENCIEALKLIKENEFDLLLLDYFLKDGTAFDICKEVRAEIKPFKIPIIILSGQTELIGNAVYECKADLFMDKGQSSCSRVVLAAKALLRRIAWERTPEQKTLKI